MRNNKNNRQEINKPAEEAVIEQPVEEHIPVKKLGVVTECFKLNVRKEPSLNSEIVATIDFATDVEVHLSTSTEDFYKVSVDGVIEGYCMKQYIAV